jgi:hypothetical protein
MSNPIRRYRGTASAVSALSLVSNSVGDAYLVTVSGNLYVWDGSIWKNKGPMLNHVTVDTDGTMTANSDLRIPTQKATVTKI